MAESTPEAVAAAFYFAGRLWDAHRGLVDAYKVDRHDEEHPSFPAWADLLLTQQLAFVRRALATEVQIYDAARDILETAS